MDKFVAALGALVVTTAMILLAALLGGFIVWILWDDSVTAIFGVRDITLWEAVMLNLLCASLFKSASPSKSNDD